MINAFIRLQDQYKDDSDTSVEDFDYGRETLEKTKDAARKHPGKSIGAGLAATALSAAGAVKARKMYIKRREAAQAELQIQHEAAAEAEATTP